MPTKKTIKAASTPSNLTINATAPVVFQAAAGEGKRPTFSIVGYTGAVMSISGFYTPVVVDLGGLKSTRERIPILKDHDPGRVVGHATAEIDDQGVRLTGTITSDSLDATDITSNARNGFEWQASIGASIVRQEVLKAGEKSTVNGREVSGPLLIARESRLHETSFVAIGADEKTSANVAASSSLASFLETAMFEKWLEAKGFDATALTETQRTSLRAAYDAEQAPKTDPPPPPPPPAVNAGGAASAASIFEEQVAKARREEGRVAKITQIAAQMISDRPVMVDEIEKLTKAAIEAGISPTDFELNMLRAMRAPAGIIRNTQNAKASVKVIEAALCIGGGLDHPEKAFDEPTLNAASDRFPQGLGLRDVLVMAARENGYTGPTSSDVRALLEAAFRPDIRAQGWSTVSLPGIFTNTANKFLKAGFMAIESTWRAIAGIQSVRDFKAMTSYSLTGGFMYEKVGPGGELKHATLGEQSYTNQAETYGRMFAITRQHIINDDLGALTSIPQKLGRGAALALNDEFWRKFMDNSAFFTAGNGNYVSGAATNLQLSSLTTGETLFMNQTDNDGYPVAIMPKILLVPNALSVTAANLMTSTQLAGDNTANTVTLMNNPHAGKFTVVRSSYLSNAAYTGNSTTAWYLLADPADMPVIEVAFLNGRQEPTVESADADFNTLGVQFRGYHDFGIAMQEYRAGVKVAGA